MRLTAVATAIIMVGLLCLSGSQAQKVCLLKLTLTDPATGQAIPGLIRVTDENGDAVEVANLLNRGRGLKEMGNKSQPQIHDWWALPKSMLVHIPRKKLAIEAISGLETEQASQTIDLTNTASSELTLSLKRFFKPAADVKTANTHLHLMKLDRETADRYLREIPRSDRLDAMFLSYLERADADRDYISNKYTQGDLHSLTRKSGVLFANGEEHRHNLTGFGEGYGHVMLLNIKRLIQPVSIGPGIMKTGDDGIPLSRGIKTAKRQQATILWCHNAWGMESTPNFLSGNVDALNIFDGGTRSTYEDSFYKYLNAGLRIPFSTGTDWFMYDMSRVYAKVSGALTPESWLKGLTDGKTFITNGPLLDLTVNGKGIGRTISLKRPGSVKLSAKAFGRIDFRTIEIIVDGKVVETVEAKPVGGHFESAIHLDLPINKSCWIALRTPSPSVPTDENRSVKTPLNELGRELFSHTSPIYVEVGSRPHFDAAAGRKLLAEMTNNIKNITETCKFADDQDRERVLDVYRDGLAVLRERMEQLK